MPDKGYERVVQSMKVRSQPAVNGPTVVPHDGWW
jgi:hypothetical protein